MGAVKESVAEKFLRYVRVDTPSDEGNFEETPSTACQFDLAEMLLGELQDLGLTARMTEHGYVYAEIPANCSNEHSIGFIAHMDVVSQPSGRGVKPVISKNERGEDIIASDGSTVLGADDKAGVAEIMALAEYVVSHKDFKHGKIGIAFTPDEEIGHGAKLFDVAGFGCDYAYTVDGETLGEISYETFNGASFDMEISGVNIHPGQAKGVMINAVVVAHEIMGRFPENERPETTEKREGYYFFTDIRGGVEKCTLHGIIRDHDRAEFERRKEFVRSVVGEISAKYGGRVKCSLRDQYYNCAEVIAPKAYIVERAKTAMIKEGVTPIVEPIRGGTDGSSLSFMGLPCPNICTGGQNAHGLNEWICVQTMEKVVAILINIAAARG